MKTMRPRPACLALAAMTLLAACAQAPRYATGEAKPAQVAVEVTNNNWMDVVIYAVSGGNRVRLGSVTTGMQQRFRIPMSLGATSGDFRLEAHPMGSAEVFASDRIVVQPGTRILWSLENQLGLSSYRLASGK